MNLLLEQHGILIMLILFVLVNIYYRNILNVLILILLFLFSNNFMNQTNAIFTAYTLTILYGIYRNFHLLENFNVKPINNIDVRQDIIVKNINKLINKEITEDSDIKLDDLKKMIKNYVKNKNAKNIVSVNKEDNSNEKESVNVNEVDNKNEVTKAPPIGSIITEDLVKQFIKIAKEKDSVNIIKTKVNLYELKPTLSKLNKKKLVKMTHDIMKGEKIKPVIISNDKFIIEGHHRWFAKKNIVETNTNGFDEDNFSEDMKVVIIDYPIKKLIQKLQEYKIKYNKEYLSKSFFDFDKMKKSTEELRKLKLKLKNIEDNLEQINSNN